MRTTGNAASGLPIMTAWRAQEISQALRTDALARAAGQGVR